MCAPKYFDIEYEINPWMHTSNQVDPAKAAEEWQNLYDTYTQKLGWSVELIDPVQGLPDMVFTANGGFVYRGKVALPHFRNPERQPETQKFEAWFKNAGYSQILMPKHDFEGEGDALLWNDTLFAGYPWRSDQSSHKELADFFGLKVVSLQLTDARFYHLDTCLTVVDDQTVTIWPPALTDEAIKQIRQLVPNVIEVSEQSALAYGLNTASDGKNIVLSNQPDELINIYKERGLNVFNVPMSEFQKSGGGVKCLTLELRS